MRPNDNVSCFANETINGENDGTKKKISFTVFKYFFNGYAIAMDGRMKCLQVSGVSWTVPAESLVLLVDGHMLEQVRDHLHNPPGRLRDAPSVLGLGVSPLHHFLLARLLQPLVEGSEALGGAVGSVPSQSVVLLRHRVPALVLVHDDSVLVGVLLQDADVRTDQLQQVQLLGEGEVGRARFTHHAGHEHRVGGHLMA